MLVSSDIEIKDRRKTQIIAFYTFLFILAHQRLEEGQLQTKPCLKTNEFAAKQICFCQNIANNRGIKNLEYDKQKIVYNKFSYDFYTPNHILSEIRECIIISVLNPHCFTIQLKEHALEFDKFQRDMNGFYNTTNDTKYHVKPEQVRINLCIVCSNPKSCDNDIVWNRSQILDFDPSDNTVNLFYVDFGTWEEYVPINRLRQITDYFHRHQVCAIPCRLAHILPLSNENDSLTWTDDATNQFLAVIDRAVSSIELLSYTPNGCFQANLFIIHSGQHVCVNDYLIHIKQAKPMFNKTNMTEERQNSIQVRYSVFLVGNH